jgi:hypothetical protein
MNRIFQKWIIIIEFENLLFSKISKKMKILEKFQKFFQKSKFSKSFKSLISGRRIVFVLTFLSKQNMFSIATEQNQERLIADE